MSMRAKWIAAAAITAVAAVTTLLWRALAAQQEPPPPMPARVHYTTPEELKAESDGLRERFGADYETWHMLENARKLIEQERSTWPEPSPGPGWRWDGQYWVSGPFV